MDSDPLRYDKWIEEALRSVIRRALAHAAADGLPGEHHFYITFRTDAEGVELPDYLRAQHPEDITIVLQHQYDDLEVGRDAFEVTLRFKGKPEHLRVPFNAVSAFADPSVNFGLQLKMMAFDGEDDDADYEDLLEDDAEDSLDMVANDGDDDSFNDAGEADSPKEPEKMGEVIALDSFRKK